MSDQSPAYETALDAWRAIHRHLGILVADALDGNEPKEAMRYAEMMDEVEAHLQKVYGR